LVDHLLDVEMGFYTLKTAAAGGLSEFGFPQTIDFVAWWLRH